MRHGRLTSAFAFLTLAGLAGAQPPATGADDPAARIRPISAKKVTGPDKAPATDFAVDFVPVPGVTPAASPPPPVKLMPVPLPVAQEVPKAPPPRVLDPKTAGPKGTDPKLPEPMLPDATKPMPPAVPEAGKPDVTKPFEVPTTPLYSAPYMGMGLGAPAPAGPQFWASAEYLYWWIRPDQVPPLVATGPATFPVGFAGTPGTVVLFGGGDLDQQHFSGVRLRAGMWLDDCRTFGVEGSFFCLPRQTDSTTFSSAQFPVLARPFTDVNPGGPNSEFLAFPGIATGSLTVENSSKFCGAALYGRCPICVDCCKRLDALVGVQYLRLEEELTITEQGTFSPTAPFPGLAGVNFLVVDQFRTRNEFYGGVVGADAQLYHGPFTLNLMATVGIGCTRQTVEILGNQVVTAPGGAPVTSTGGLLAQPGNIGRHTNQEFSVVPQVGLNVGYQVCCNVQVFAGYTFLYWTNVARPGGQIDPVLDVNRIPNFGGGAPATANRPVVPFTQQDFWVQGVSVGVQFSW